jgi:hypothetical protein
MTGQSVLHTFKRYRTLQTHRITSLAYCDIDAPQRL